MLISGNIKKKLGKAKLFYKKEKRNYLSLLKIPYSTITARIPTKPELPNVPITETMLPITSIGTKTTLSANRTCSITASPSKDMATLVRPPIQDLIVETTASPAIMFPPVWLFKGTLSTSLFGKCIQGLECCSTPLLLD